MARKRRNRKTVAKSKLTLHLVVCRKCMAKLASLSGALGRCGQERNIGQASLIVCQIVERLTSGLTMCGVKRADKEVGNPKGPEPDADRKWHDGPKAL